MSSSDDDDDIGPRLPEVKRLRPVKAEVPHVVSHVAALHALGLPTGEMYENSFMHKCAVSRVFGSVSTNFVVSVSNGDGVVKFWKKVPIGIEFVKAVSCGSVIIDSALCESGRELAVVSKDETLRVFDVELFSLTSVTKLGFNCGLKICAVSDPLVAVSTHSGAIYIVDKEQPKQRWPQFTLHTSQVTHMVYSALMDMVISIDLIGSIEVWSHSSLALPNTVKFSSKLDSDLFALRKRKTVCLSLAVGKFFFAILTCEFEILIFDIFTCKIVHVISDEPKQEHLKNAFSSSQPIGICFDDSGKVLIYPSSVGIKLFDVAAQGKLLAVLGQVESGERFMDLCVFQGAAQREVKLLTGKGGDDSSGFDPTIVATAFGKNRFYLFSNRLPGEGRDLFNEEAFFSVAPAPARNGGGLLPPQTACTAATLHTTLGDIQLSLLPLLAPKAVENFTALARSGYFDGVIFHRVVKNFMIQTGDPEGTGSGGASIWNKAFPDEISPFVKFNKPFLLAMANHGPDTNGSQFFITTVATPWLDGKHTIFGAVKDGFDVVRTIENLPTDPNDRPVGEDVKILTVNPAF